MNRRLQRLKGRAQLQAYLNFGRLMRTIAPGQKRKVDRSVVGETWKAVADGQHNSNTDMTFWNGHFYICHQASPFHLGTSRSRMRLWRSADAHNWTLVREFRAPEGEYRDPTFGQIHDRLYIYFLPNRERNPEPYTTSYTYTMDGDKWTDVVEVDHPGWLYWRPKTLDNKTWYVTAYWHEHGKSQLLKSADGEKWEIVSMIWEGEKNDETDFEFMADGRILSTARLEGHNGWRGDPMSSTLISVAAPPYTTWEHNKSYVTRFDGPCLFAYNGRVYGIGRYQSNFLKGFVEQGGLFSRKRTSVFLFEPDRMVHLTDLPSAGDTSYAGIAIRGSDLFTCYYTSSPKKDPSWVEGMFGPTDIRMACIDLPALERLATSVS